MALQSVASLLQPQTPAQMRANMVNMLIALNIPANLWVNGGVASSLLTITASSLSSCQNLLVQAIASGFLNSASGSWLALLAYYVYGVTVPVATFASGQLVLTNGGGGVFNFAPYTASFADPVTGQTYQNVTAISLSSVGQTQTITIQCTVAGSIGNASPGAISGPTAFVTTMLGVTCTNPSAIVGVDGPNDATIRTICTNKLGSLSSRGPSSAYSYAVQVATGVISGLPVNINRSTVTPSSSTGVVQLYVASPSGAASADDINGVIASCNLIAVPDAVTLFVFSANPVPDTSAYTVWVQSNGVPAATIQAAIVAQLASFYSSPITSPIGGLKTDAGNFIFATGKAGAIGDAVYNAGAALVSVEGAVDTPMSVGTVCTNSTSVTVRLVS